MPLNNPSSNFYFSYFQYVNLVRQELLLASLLLKANRRILKPRSKADEMLAPIIMVGLIGGSANENPIA